MGVSYKNQINIWERAMRLLFAIQYNIEIANSKFIERLIRAICEIFHSASKSFTF